MRLKLKKISTKSFVLVFSAINVIAGFILGIIVTITSLVYPNEEGSALGVWSVLIFPVVNGLLGMLTGAFLTGLYNLLAPRLGGLELEFETSE